jgi:DNA mismatch repair protein MutS
MAGLPQELTDRAGEILRNLEGSDLNVHSDGTPDRKRKGRIAGAPVQMTLFEMKDDALRAELATLDVDTMTPLEALQALATLRRKATST